MDYAAIIKEIGRGAKGARSIDQAQAATLFGAMLDGEIPDLELGAILMALRIKGESLPELQGFKSAIDTRCLRIALPDSPRCIVLPSYNGARRHPNLLPLVALLLARQGIPVLIQGRHDFPTRINPFTLLSALGVDLSNTVEEAGTRLRNGQIACLAVETLLPGLARLLALRPRMGVRSCAHTLAKILDPCPGQSVRIVPITHPAYQANMTDLLIAEKGYAVLMRATEGEAYANPSRPLELSLFRNHIVQHHAQAETEIPNTWPGLPANADITENAVYIRSALEGNVPVPAALQEQVNVLSLLARAA